MKISKQSIYKMYLVAGLLLPILLAYTTPLSGITFGDVFLALSLICIILSCKKVKYQNGILFIIIYIVILSFGLAISDTFLLSTLFTTLRYILYLMYILILPTVRGNEDYAASIYKRICVFAAILLILQFISLHTTGYALPGVLQFLPLTDSALYDYKNVVYFLNSRRCMSLFGEPSHYAIYVLPCIALCLFRYKHILKKDIIIAGLLSLTIIMSSSFTGVIALVFVWGYWIIQNIIKKKFSWKILVLFILGLSAMGFLIFKTKLGGYFLDEEIYGRQSSGRFSGYSFLNELKLSFDKKLFGYGMHDVGDEGIYLSGWPRLYYYYGIVGSVIYLMGIISCAVKKRIGSVILLLLFVLMIGSEVNFMPMFVVYMIFIILFSKEKMLIDKK